MFSPKLRRVLIVCLLLISLVLLLWGFWPLESVTHSRLISPADLQLPTPESWLPLAWRGI